MNCDRIAPHYRWIETLVFGSALQRRRTAFLARTKLCRQALILGEGDGRFLETFLRTNQSAFADCIDVSVEMVACARGRLQHDETLARRVGFRTCDVFDAVLETGRYDLVVTFFFLDCFGAEQLQRLIPRIAAACAADAIWLVADFRLPAKAGPRLRARLWLEIMYRFFNLATSLRTRRLVDPAPFLRTNGFELAESSAVQAGFLVTEVWRSVVPRRPLFSPA